MSATNDRSPDTDEMLQSTRIVFQLKLLGGRHVRSLPVINPVSIDHSTDQLSPAWRFFHVSYVSREFVHVGTPSLEKFIIFDRETACRSKCVQRPFAEYWKE
jgi:hypothetical protein